jgi:hypothetical protein
MTDERTENGAETEVDSASAGSDLISMARRIGQHVWLERTLFGWLGEWSRVDAAPQVTVFFGEQAARHGWHAEVMFDRLPELRELDPESVVAPADRAAANFVQCLCEPPAPARLPEALAGHCRVLLPALIGSYRRLVAESSPAADGSLRRWTGFVLADDVDEWCRGEALVRSLATDAAGVERTTGRQRELELLLLGCRGFLL